MAIKLCAKIEIKPPDKDWFYILKTAKDTIYIKIFPEVETTNNALFFTTVICLLVI